MGRRLQLGLNFALAFQRFLLVPDPLAPFGQHRHSFQLGPPDLEHVYLVWPLDRKSRKGQL